MTGWREFWRRLQRRGWRRRARRELERGGVYLPGVARPSAPKPGVPFNDHPNPDVQALQVPKPGVLFPGVPIPEGPLPGEAEPSTPIPVHLNQGETRRETLQAMVEEMRVFPADPVEGEAYLRAWLELTSRQKQVVCLVCAGHTNREIARRLRISPNTVKGHLTLALGRFGLRSRAELRVALAGWDFSRWRE